MLIFIKAITFYVGSGIKLYNYILIEIAIIIIVFAHTRYLFFGIIIMSKGNDKTQKGQTTWKQSQLKK